MSDYIAAEIKIGGRIPAALVPALCEAIANQHLSLEYGECIFEPHTAGDLLEARTNLDGVSMLRLYDDDAAWGEFPELEAFLEQHNIPYDRFHEGKFDTDPRLQQFRPGVGCRDFPATSGRHVVVLIRDLLLLPDGIVKAINQLDDGEYQQAAQQLRAVEAELKQRLVQPVALPGLEIEESSLAEA